MTTIDPQAIRALQDLNPGDDSFLRDLIQIFLEDTPRRLAEIDDGLARGDGRQLSIAAHSLKGSSANFGAEPFRRRCAKVEQLGRDGALDAVRAELPPLREEFDRVRTELEAFLRPA